MPDDRRDASNCTVTLTREELLLVNNALNEICNGLHLEDVEFSTRLGASQTKALSLLQRIGNLLQNNS
jgi:hypothetical protein